MKKTKQSQFEKDICNLTWGLFEYKGMSFPNIVKNIFHDSRIVIKRTKFLLKNGYPEPATWETFHWFIKVMKKILINYRYHRTGTPFLPTDDCDLDYCIKEWDDALDCMIDLLDKMDETNPIYKGKSFNYVAPKTVAAKDEFFELFSKYFFNLWD